MIRFLPVLGLIMMLAAHCEAQASGDCRDGSCNEVTQSIEAPVSVAGDRSDSLGIGVSNSFGGVAVGDCVITTQTNIVVVGWQRHEENPWCMAMFYDQNGMHDTAARMRCTIEDVRSLFGNRQECIVSNTVKSVPRETAVNELATAIAVQAEQYDRFIADLTAQIETLRSDLEKQRSAAQRPQRRPQTIIQPQPFLTDEKRAALAAIRGE